MTFGNARLINDNKVSVFILVHNKEGVHYCDKIICQSQIVSVWEELKIKLKIKPITDVRKDLMNMEPSKGHVPNKQITEANGTVMVTNIYRTSKFFFFSFQVTNLWSQPSNLQSQVHEYQELSIWWHPTSL